VVALGHLRMQATESNGRPKSMSSEMDAGEPSLCAGWSWHRGANGDTLRTMLQRTGGRHAQMFAAPTRLLSSKTYVQSPPKLSHEQIARRLHGTRTHYARTGKRTSPARGIAQLGKPELDLLTVANGSSFGWDAHG
jgi:hypothetical protein